MHSVCVCVCVCVCSRISLFILLGILYTVEPLYKGHLGTSNFCP